MGSALLAVGDRVARPGRCLRTIKKSWPVLEGRHPRAPHLEAGAMPAHRRCLGPPGPFETLFVCLEGVQTKNQPDALARRLESRAPLVILNSMDKGIFNV